MKTVRRRNSGKRALAVEPLEDRIVLASTPIDYSGNQIEAARSYGEVSAPRSYNDFVGNTDPRDFYRFTLAALSDVSLRLSGMTANADMRLLNSRGGVIASAIATGITVDTLGGRLATGTYYVVVFPQSAAVSTQYTLTIGATVVLPEPGNIQAAARDLGSLATALNAADQVGGSDPRDFYRFTLADEASILLRLSNLSSAATVRLLNTRGGVISTSAATSPQESELYQVCKAGTYYAVIYPNISTASTSYTFTAARAVKPVPFDGAGNTFSKSRYIGELDTPVAFQDTVDENDHADFYAFDVNSSVLVDITLDGLGNDADLYLYDLDHNSIDLSVNTGTKSERISGTLSGNTYFVKVVGFEPTNYTLTFQIGSNPTPPPTPTPTTQIPSQAVRYRISTSGTTYTGDTGFLLSTTQFSVADFFTRSGYAYLTPTAPLAGSTSTGTNARDFAFSAGTVGAFGAGNTTFSTNTVLARYFGYNTGGSGVDVANVAVDYVANRITIDLVQGGAGSTIARQNPYNTTVVGSTIGSPVMQLVAGRIVLEFRDGGSTILGSFRLFAEGKIESRTGKIEGSFYGSLG
jgi:hypothetical protein